MVMDLPSSSGSSTADTPRVPDPNRRDCDESKLDSPKGCLGCFEGQSKLNAGFDSLRGANPVRMIGYTRINRSYKKGLVFLVVVIGRPSGSVGDEGHLVTWCLGSTPTCLVGLSKSQDSAGGNGSTPFVAVSLSGLSVHRDIPNMRIGGVPAFAVGELAGFLMGGRQEV